MRSSMALGGGFVFALLLGTTAVMAQSNDDKCKKEPVVVEGGAYVSQALGAYPDSLFAWRAAVLEKFGNGWQAWRNAADAKVDCEKRSVEGKIRWVCMRTARPCLGPLSTITVTEGGKKPVWTRTMRRGDSGEDVTTLQKILNDLGAKLEVDGTYGRATKEAVRAFQKTNGLQADGNFGPDTQAKLNAQI